MARSEWYSGIVCISDQISLLASMQCCRHIEKKVEYYGPDMMRCTTARMEWKPTLWSNYRRTSRVVGRPRALSAHDKTSVCPAVGWPNCSPCDQDHNLRILNYCIYYLSRSDEFIYNNMSINFGKKK